MASVPLLGVVAAFGIAPTTVTENVERKIVVQEVSLAGAAPMEQGETLFKFHREERIQRGDTLATVLTRLGVDDPIAMQQMQNVPEAQGFYQLRPGSRMRAVTTDDGMLLSLRYVSSDDHELVAERVALDQIAVSRQPLALQRRLELGSGRIKSSLFQAIDDAGLDDDIAVQLADIFSGEIDFHRDLQPGDRFSVVYEALHNKNEFVRTGRVVAAEFRNGGRTLMAFLHTNSQGNTSYYNEQGKSLKKAFLRSPLEFSRITSGFSSSRFHPVLATWRAHRGVDYGAPHGTRVRATADGIVKLAGKMGGYGNVLILRHPNGHETLYGHLSAFANGLKQGQRVSQSDIIGFVGMTGMATGPHLHYELRINGVHHDPLTAVAPPALGITAEHRSEFSRAIEVSQAQLNLIRGIDLAGAN